MEQQLHNESNQDNTTRNLLLILLVIVVGMGGFMIYNTVYNSPAAKAAQNSKENVDEMSLGMVASKMGTWTSNFYHSLTSEGRIIVYGIGCLLGVRILWPIIRWKKKPKNSK